MPIIDLPDGLKLGFAEYGNIQGSPVLFCHGAPGSRLTISDEMSRAAAALNIRLIALDRPGYGLSDPSPNRSIVDWPKDVAILLQALGIDRFGVLGYSMGSPYALACAHAMTEQITRVTLVGGAAPNPFDPAVIEVISPGSNALFVLARDNPPQLLATLKALAPDGASLFAAMAAGFPECDKALATQPEIGAAFLRDCDETLRQGYGAATEDFVLAVNAWGFKLGEIQVPVNIWNGLADLNAPSAMAQYLAANLPRSKLNLLPGAGHLCLFSHWENILEDML